MNRVTSVIVLLLMIFAPRRFDAQVTQPPSKTAIIELSLQELKASAPVVVTSVQVNGKEVDLLPFPVDSNDPWLKHLSVEVANKSKQSIDGIAIQLFFPESGTGSRQNPFMAYDYQWGATNIAVINAPLMTDHTMPTSLNLAAGASASIDLGPLFVEYEQRLKTYFGASMPTRVGIYITTVTFSDGVQWYGNAFFRRSSTGSITPVDAKEMLP